MRKFRNFNSKNIFNTDIYLRDILNLTTQRLKARRYRTILTILGVGIGIAVVYILVSLTFGLQKLVIGNIATSETLLSLDVLPNTEIKDIVKITKDDVDYFHTIENVNEVSPAKSLPTEIVYNNIKSQTISYGIEPRYFSLSNITADKGELFTDEQSKIVVTSSVLSLFDIKESDAIGTKIRLSFIKPSDLIASESGVLSGNESIEIPEQFEISGIINDDTNYIYLPLNYFDLVDIDEFHAVKVKVKSADDIESVRDKILAKGYLVSALTDTITQINGIFKVTQITFTVIGITALFIAAIGMMNTMTVSLLERTKEIGIMKAIGATSRGIRHIFLAESMIMGLGGGIGGLLVGSLLTNLLDIIVRVLAVSLGGKPVDVFYTPLWFYLLVGAFSLIIGLVTGILPARRASMLNPLDALRYE